jgi:hypothetical protein
MTPEEFMCATVLIAVIQERAAGCRAPGFLAAYAGI